MKRNVSLVQTLVYWFFQEGHHGVESGLVGDTAASIGCLDLTCVKGKTHVWV